jgi:hypothetical protein
MWELKVLEEFKGSVGDGITPGSDKHVALVGAAGARFDDGKEHVFFLNAIGPYLYAIAPTDGESVLQPSDALVKDLRRLAGHTAAPPLCGEAVCGADEYCLVVEGGAYPRQGQPSSSNNAYCLRLPDCGPSVKKPSCACLAKAGKVSPPTSSCRERDGLTTLEVLTP